MEDNAYGNKSRQVDMDDNSAEVYGGIFQSLEAAEDFMRLVDGTPQRFYQELYLEGEFKGRIEIRFFDKPTNQAEELYRDHPYGDAIVEGLRARFHSKLKRRVNTAIVIYDFYLGSHFTGRPIRAMTEKKTDEFHIFNVDCIYPYRK